jgi:hypothetical protein
MSTTYNQIQTDATTAGGFKILLTITDNTGAAIAGQPTILIDMPGLASVIASGSFTNIDVGWQVHEYYDATNSCTPMRFIYLGTAAEPVP